MMKYLLVLLVASISLVAAQQCASNQFSIKNGDGTEYLTINSATDVKTCGGINICDALNQGKQSLTIEDDGKLSISNGNTIQLPDNSATNELQSLALDGDLLSISSKNSVQLPDSSDTNELQSLSLQNGILSISGGNTVTLPDISAENELQSLSLSGSGQLSISDRNFVQLPDTSATNELQSLSLQNGALKLTNDNAQVELKNLKTFLGFSVRVPVGTLKSGGSWTIMPFGEIVWTTFPASSFNNVTKSFNPPINGYYRFSLRGYTPTSATTSTDRYNVSWNLNDDKKYHGSCGGTYGCCGSAISTCVYIMPLTTSDTVRAQMHSTIDVMLGYPQDSSAITTQFEWQTEYLGPL